MWFFSISQRLSNFSQIIPASGYWPKLPSPGLWRGKDEDKKALEILGPLFKCFMCFPFHLMTSLLASVKNSIISADWSKLFWYFIYFECAIFLIRQKPSAKYCSNSCQKCAMSHCGVFPVESWAQHWRIIVQIILEKYSWIGNLLIEKLICIFFSYVEKKK